MTRFVVFLRAVNVGGHNVVAGKLQDAFASMGFGQVSTYKQSGNVLFETDSADPEAIRKQVKEKLPRLLGFDVGVFVRTLPRLKAIIEADPFKSQVKEGASFQVTFLLAAPEKFPLKLPVDIPNSTAEIISVNGKEVFSVTRGHGDGGKPNPFLESKLKVQATTRNWNIIKEIVEKFPETDEKDSERKKE
jgi:uncharacterized protein (DUF1697 family)